MSVFFYALGALFWLAAINYGYPVIAMTFTLVTPEEIGIVGIMQSVVPATLLATGFGIIGTLFVGFGAVLEELRKGRAN